MTERGDARSLDHEHSARYRVGNAVCRVLFPRSLQFLPHHKTGVVLSKNMRNIISGHCNISYFDESLQSQWEAVRWLNFRDSAESLTAVRGDKEENIKIHFYRDPVLTIISGFFYHSTFAIDWTSTPFSMDKFRALALIFGNTTRFQALYASYKYLTWTFDGDSEPPIWRTRLNRKQRHGTELRHVLFRRHVFNEFQLTLKMQRFSNIKLLFVFMALLHSAQTMGHWKRIHITSPRGMSLFL